MLLVQLITASHHPSIRRSITIHHCPPPDCYYSSSCPFIPSLFYHTLLYILPTSAPPLPFILHRSLDGLHYIVSSFSSLAALFVLLACRFFFLIYFKRNTRAILDTVGGGTMDVLDQRLALVVHDHTYFVRRPSSGLF